MAVVPHLTDHGPPAVGAALAGLGGVVPRAAAADVRGGAVLFGQLVLDSRQRVLGLVAGGDLRLGQPVVRRETSVELDGGLEEIDHLLVLFVLGPVAGDVKGRVASGVLGEFVAPEVRVGRPLVDPVRVHPREQIHFAKRLEERADVGPLVRGHGGAVGQTVGRVGGRGRVVLSAQVAVLGVAAVAKVGPEAVEGPRLCGQELALFLEPGVRGPELGGQKEASVRLGTACVDGQRIGGARRT